VRYSKFLLQNYSCQRESYLTTNGQSACLSWYQATIWDQRPILPSLSRKLSPDVCGVFVWGAISDERTGLQFTCTIAIGPCQCCQSRAQVLQNVRPYLPVSFETVFPFCRLLRLTGLRWRHSNSSPYFYHRHAGRTLLRLWVVQ
jgi:hypothetical protein